jgi:hypothetical protein
MSWKERVLGIILAILPTAIVLASAYLPVQESNLDIEKSIIDFDQVQRVAEKFQPERLSGDIIEIGSIEANEEETKLTLYVQSPLKTEMKVKELSIEILNSQESTKLELKDEVTLMPGERKTVQLTGGGIVPLPDTRPGEIYLEVEVLGVTMEMRR